VTVLERTVQSRVESWLPIPRLEVNLPYRLAAPARDNTGAVYLRDFGTFAVDRRRVYAALCGPVLDASSTTATLTTIVRCSRCRSRPTVQSAIEFRSGVEYLTPRCASCSLLYDGQVNPKPLAIDYISRHRLSGRIANRIPLDRRSRSASLSRRRLPSLRRNCCLAIWLHLCPRAAPKAQRAKEDWKPRRAT
jgi:hypothetical protein